MKIKWLNRKKTLGADVIALLAQAHTIHQMELEMARDKAREETVAEYRQKVRDAVMDFHVQAKWSPAAAEDSLRIVIGLLFSDTPEQEAEWLGYVREHRIAAQEAKYRDLQQQLHGPYHAL